MEPLTLEITSVVAGGDGLGRDASGRVTFVPGALPGETVRVELHQQKKDFARGRVVDVVVPSPDRAAPPCPFVAAGCGGCDWQHVQPGAQRRLKAAVVADALRRQARIDVVVDEGPVLLVRGVPDDACAAWPPTDASGSGVGTATSSSTWDRAWSRTRCSTSW